jgi:hypothetical protein
MSHGIYITNSSGFVLIDQEYSNYRLIQSGTASMESSVSFPAQSNGVAVFVGHTPSSRQVSLLSISSSSFVLRGTTSEMNSGNYQQFSISYRVYALISANVPPSSYGLVVNNSAGDRVFTSEAKYPLVNQVVFYNAPPTSAVTISVPSDSPFVSIGETLAFSLAISPLGENIGPVFQPAYDIKPGSVVVRSSRTNTQYPGGTGEYVPWASNRNLISLRA